MLSMQRGDTIVEVMVAFAVFALVAMGAMTVMNRGSAIVERSLEITLVREQIDAQAQILRYARDTDSPAWTTILGNLATASGDSCPTAGGVITPANQAFISSIDTSGNVSYTRFSSTPGSFQQPATYSQFSLGTTPQAFGMWVVPVQVGTTDSYDMHIRACWFAPGDTMPSTVGTIVRLYET